MDNYPCWQRYIVKVSSAKCNLKISHCFSAQGGVEIVDIRMGLLSNELQVYIVLSSDLVHFVSIWLMMMAITAMNILLYSILQIHAVCSPKSGRVTI